MYLAFNETCVNEDVSKINNIVEAREQINNFIELIHKLKTTKLLDGLVLPCQIDFFKVCSEYGINEWLQDPLVSMKSKQFFRTTWGKNCSYIEATNFNSECYILIEGQKYLGIGNTYAVETQSRAISILTNDYFQEHKMDGIYLYMDENSDINEKSISIENISYHSDIENLKNEIKHSYFSNISSGQDLWEQREKLFPNLIFCESVKDQLYKDPEKFHIIQIMNKLQRIEEYFGNYEGQYNRKDLGLSARSESESVKTDSALKNMRKFIKPNGEKDYFFEHIGFSGKFSAGRIHFLPDDTLRKCYIGYIGRHIPTKLF